jgi:class 3 adenylate cyclase
VSTEHVIVLFTDIVGSTQLSLALAPHEADELRRRHFAILRRAILDHDGREAKTLGDGMMAVFESASSAVGCSVAMQQGVDAQNQRSGHHIEIRVGLSGGEATRDGDDYFGDPVVEAARLCAVSAGRQILVSDVVRLIAGRRTVHKMSSIGAIELKGFPEPIETFEVMWDPIDQAADIDSIPLPPRLAMNVNSVFAGRSNELATLLREINEKSANLPPRVVLVTGEAGLGKTTLAAHAARSSYDNGACVLFGYSEQFLTLPYQPFARTIEHYVRHAPLERLVDHVFQYGSALGRLAPSLAKRLDDLPPTRATDPDSERFLLFAAVVALLSDLSSRQQVVMMLDDIQWADDGSLSLLRHLIVTDQPMNLAIIATCRDNEISSSAAMVETLGALHRHQCFTRLDLTGLGTDDVTSMLASNNVAIDDAARNLAADILRETDGNAFFVNEVLRHLIETGAIAESEGVLRVANSSDGVSLPRSLIDVVTARLTRLGDDAIRLLSLAAVIGREFTVDLLARVSTSPISSVLDVLDDAGAASLTRESSEVAGRFAFAHALIQHALFERLSLTRRAQMHRDIALAIEATVGEFSHAQSLELANHWSSTGQLGDVTRAIRYCCLAGDQALAALAPIDALRLYEQASTLMLGVANLDEALSIDVAIGLGTSQRHSGRPAFRETLIGAAHRAARLSDLDRLTKAVLANSRGWYSASGVVDWDKVALLELVLDRLEPSGSNRALVLATLCAELTFNDNVEQRLQLAEEALRLARLDGDSATLVRILNLLVFPLLIPSMMEQSLQRSYEAMHLADEIGDPLLLFSSALYRATVATRAGDILEVDRCFSVASELVAQLNQPSLNWEYTFHRAKRAQIAGNLEEAETLASLALQIGTECGEPDATTFFGVQYAVVAWQSGTMGILAPIIEQMIADNPGLPTIRASLAMAYSEGDMFDECRQVLDAFAAINYELRIDTAWINGMTEYAVAAINLGDPRYCAALYDLLAPWSAQFSSAGGVTAEGPVSLWLGELAGVLLRHDDALAHLGISHIFCERFGAWFFAARTAFAQGAVLANRAGPGDVEHARELLLRAQSLSTTRGYAGIEKKATALLTTLN